MMTNSSDPIGFRCRYVLCYTTLFQNLREYGGDEAVIEMGAIYSEIVTSSILDKLQVAKQDFHDWIAEGQVDGFEQFHCRFEQLAEKYSSVLEAMQDLMSEKTYQVECIELINPEVRSHSLNGRDLNISE